MTWRELISKIRIELREVSADNRLPNKFLYSKFITKAYLIIQRESDALRLSNVQGMYQTLKCVDVKEIPAIDPHCKITSRATLYRSVVKIPKPFFDSDGPIIRSVRSLDRSQDITITTFDSIQRGKEDTNSKYDKSIYGVWEEEYLYLTKKIPVRIEALFPMDVSDWCSCECAEDDKPCRSFLDTNVYVPEKLIDPIVTLVLQDLMQSYKRIVDDSIVNKSQSN